jgi:hypothetical protein
VDPLVVISGVEMLAGLGPLRLQQLVRINQHKINLFAHCNIDADSTASDKLLLRIAADIEELEGTTSAAWQGDPRLRRGTPVTLCQIARRATRVAAGFR